MSTLIEAAESLFQQEAEALAKSTGLPLVDAVDMLTEPMRFVVPDDGSKPFSIEEFRASNGDDPECESMVLDLAKLPVGGEIRFGIGGGWGEPIRRVR